jgi:FKBP-type peptidyl-prolyl cis-trans isomerase FklB
MKLTILSTIIAAFTLLISAPGARAQLGKEEGEAYLAENAKKDGVKVLPSGLQYRVLKEGVGKQPTKDDSVVVHYKGTLIDGREFDSSYKRNEPAEFGVTQVIKGWTEALQLMKEGSKWMIYVPWSLAYGAQGRGGLIGPHETLVFEVELIRIK